jgi:hypothetical protein
LLLDSFLQAEKFHVQAVNLDAMADTRHVKWCPMFIAENTLDPQGGRKLPHNMCKNCTRLCLRLIDNVCLQCVGLRPAGWYYHSPCPLCRASYQAILSSIPKSVEQQAVPGQRSANSLHYGY